jgi:aspartyl-tRNA(Asn)/glutamyl-tRNA(Gln) amidotransferase subunit C
MISFVQKMDEVNTGDIEPLQHITSEKNVWREDEIKGSCSQEQALKNAAHHNNQFFMVPKIIQKH